MKNNKLIISFLMLLVTAVALTTASYAWFSQSTTVAVDGLDVNVTAASGIQVSTDAQNWKSILSTSDILAAADPEYANYVGHTNQIPSSFAPVSTIGSQTAGIFDMYFGELDESTSDVVLNTALLTDTAGTGGHYMAFDLFLSVVEETQVELNTGSGVVSNGEIDSGLQYSSRIGFLHKGTDATATPATARALNATTEQLIWEPNADQHTAFAVNNLGAVNGVIEPYYGVKAAGIGLPFDDPLHVDFGTYFELVEAPKLITSIEGEIPTGTIFTLTPGITKLRIYAWIEGQDIDCENTASLGTGITITIALKKAE